ncbi:heparinase II/III domain-containing protein [Paenibacillus koleovorans]|uniref:heparinase II/III domain-containing protein n=1 Tax=Paenibacillus koleovorans TaxID=121608 RepID=UPI000FDB1B8E|nr:heparinase II/III family protein [Paenibacillus koleovorans]
MLLLKPVKNMYKKIAMTALLAAAVIVPLAVSPQEASAGDAAKVTIANNGFETGSPPSNWSVFGGTWGTQQSISTTRSIDGTKSLKINDASNNGAYGMVSDRVSAHSFSTYEAYASVYAESGTGQLYLEFWDSSNTRIGVQFATTKTTGDWEYVKVSGVAPAGTSTVSIMMYTSKTNVGVVYFDAVSMRRIDEVGQIANAGIENADGANMPLDWTTYSAGTYSASTDYAHSGAKSLKIVDSSTSAAYGMKTIKLPASAGKTYEATAWVRNTSGAGQLYLEFFQSTVGHASDTRVGVQFIGSTTTGTWEKLTVSGTAPAGTDYLMVMAYTPAASTATSYFDDFSVRQKYAAPSPAFTPVVTGHPRLYFTAADVPGLRAKALDTAPNKYGESYASIWSKVEDQADIYMAESSYTVSYAGGVSVTYPLPPVQPKPHQNPPGYTSGHYPFWTAVGSQLQGRMETLALAYVVTQDNAYGEKARDYALALADWDVWSDPAYPCLGGGSGFSCLDSNYIVRGVAAVYDMVYDLLTPTEREKLLTAMYEKGIRLMKKDLETYVDQNIYYAVSGATATAAVVGLGERDSYDSYLGQAYNIHLTYLNTLNGSGKSEGFLYTGVGLNSIFAADDFVRRVTGVDDAFEHPFIGGRLAKWLVHFNGPQGTGNANFSDSDTAGNIALPALILANAGDGIAGYYVKEQLSDSANWGRFVYLNDSGALTTPTAAGMPLSVSYTDIGYQSFRTGWTDNDTMLAFYSDDSNYGHNQQDDNSFILNAGGEWLLTDPGYFNNASAATTAMTTGSIGHNTMLVNGTGQSNKSGGGTIGFFTSPVFDLGIGDATASYTTTPNVSQWKRRIISVKPDYNLIVDNVALASAGTPEMLFHTDKGGVFTSGGTPLTVGSALPSSFVIEKARASAAVQLLRPSSATRTYTQYSGAEMYGTWGSIKPSSTVTSESFVTLIRPKVDRTGIIEAETLLPAAATSGDPVIPGMTKFYRGVTYAATAVNDYITYNINVPSNGNYDLRLGFIKVAGGGTIKVELDGVQLQTGIDLYDSYVDTDERSYLNRGLTAGTHTLKLTATGKNGSSTGYSIPLDYVRLTAAGTTIAKAAPYTVSTATNGLATGLVITLTGASDQVFVNPTNAAVTTASNLTIGCSATQCMARKLTGGGYERYAAVNSSISGNTLTDGTQVLASMTAGGGIAIGKTSATAWTGTITLTTAGSPQVYAPSVSAVKLDGVTLSGGQYSYNSTTKLLTINSVSAATHSVEITL